MIRHQYEGAGVSGIAALAGVHEPAALVVRYREMLRIRRVEEEIDPAEHSIQGFTQF